MSTLAHDAATSSGMLWAGRLMSAVVILFLLFDGGIKLVPLDIVLSTSKELGIPIHLARTLGVITVGCALLYAIPRTAMLGAVLFTGYLGGAIYVHVLNNSPLFSHTLFGVYLGILMWGGLWLRDARLRSLFPIRRD
jgi:hypothetical protein